MFRRLYTVAVLAVVSTTVTAQTPSSGGWLMPPVAVGESATRPAMVPSTPLPDRDLIQPVRADLPATLGSVRPVGGPVVGDQPVSQMKVAEDEAADLFLAARRSQRPRDQRKDVDLSSNRLTERERDRQSFRLRDWFGETFLNGGDACFDNFISPVTNPALFEDPRSLSELRPIFYYQKIPNGQPEFQGGHIWYFGTQARLAFNERWSIVLNKLGAVSINPGVTGPFDKEFGFGEIHLGPKYTFIRNKEFDTLAAAGVTFQLPFGSSNVYQDTGTLSMVPYITAAQKLVDSDYGALNGMATGGYAFSTNRERSDYFFLSGHLDFDVRNNHRLYPLIEMNWFSYSSNGTTLPFGFEGRDVANFGGNAKGTNLVTLAFGARFKITENAQVGGAYEMPIIGRKDLFRHRFTVDLILRF